MSVPDLQRIAVVAAQWHADIVDRAIDAFTIEMRDRGYTLIDIVRVPGSFEIPLQVQRLAKSHTYAAIAACGLIVDGGIYRHDYVANTVIDSLMRIQLETNTPVFSAVLTPHHFHDHTPHVEYFRTHLVTKGQELARACATTLAISTAA